MTDTTKERAQRDPTPEELKSSRFNAIWEAIKGWDLQREPGAGYAGATGTDVCTILDALARAEQSTETPPTLEVQQLAVDLCRELYDRFMMGGWTSEDAHAETVSRLRKWAEAPRPVGTPEKCPICGSERKEIRNTMMRTDIPVRGPMPFVCGNPWHDGPVGTPDSAIESADELAKAAFALGKLAGERGKKP